MKPWKTLYLKGVCFFNDTGTVLVFSFKDHNINMTQCMNIHAGQNIHIPVCSSGGGHNVMPHLL